MNRRGLLAVATAAVALFVAQVATAGGGQRDLPPWMGTWALNPAKSTIKVIAGPGAGGARVVSQSLHIEQVDADLELIGNTVMADERVAYHEDLHLNLDGSEAPHPPAVFTVKVIDAATFEITSRVNTPGINLTEVSRFVVSTDGNTLTETKTQIERQVVPKTADQTTGAVLNTATSVLVFERK